MVAQVLRVVAQLLRMVAQLLRMVAQVFHPMFLAAGRAPLMVLLLTAAALPACGQSGARMAGVESFASVPEPVVVTGRVVAQGRTAYQDVLVSVARVSDPVVAEVVAEGLEVPWALDFTPMGGYW